MYRRQLDGEKFIADVRAYPGLWDRAHPLYKEKLIAECQWETVASANHMTVAEAKRKWKILKDTFRLELKKVHPDKIGLPPSSLQMEDYLSRWGLFKHIFFVRDQMFCYPRIKVYTDSPETSPNILQPQNNKKLKKLEVGKQDVAASGNQYLIVNLMETNLETTAKDMARSIGNSDLMVHTEVNGEPTLETRPETTFSFPQPSQVIKALETSKDERQSARMGKIGLVDGGKLSEDDDDLLFLLSLLPSMKKLNHEKKLYLRCKIQELTYQYVYKGCS